MTVHPGVSHEWRRMGEPAHVLDARPWRCIVPGCRVVTHSAACVDDDGKVECVCGLDELREREADRVG